MTTPWVCATCGVQHAESAQPPPSCPICEDERQYVGHGGQRWLSPAELAVGHEPDLREEEAGLVGIGLRPSLAIGQRALLVQTAGGNVLWDCLPVMTEQVGSRIEELGGIRVICCSHPHFYGACVDFAEAFDATVLLPAADRSWVMRTSPHVEFFTDDALEPVPGLTLARVGGHFDGAAVLHWPAGAGGRGALLTGDTVMVVADRRYVSFMWSYPNLIPLPAEVVRNVADRLIAFGFDRLYGGWWDRVVIHDAREAVRRSADRYLARLGGATSTR